MNAAPDEMQDGVRPDGRGRGDVQPDRTRPDNARPGDGQDGKARPEDARPEDARSGNARSGNARSDNARPDNVRLERNIARKAERRARSLREGRHSVWFGIGMFGLVGWAVAVPTMAGIAVGIWLDRRLAGGPSWVLTGLILGVLLGSLNAWWWVRRTGIQDRAMPGRDARPDPPDTRPGRRKADGGEP